VRGARQPTEDPRRFPPVWFALLVVALAACGTPDLPPDPVAPGISASATETPSSTIDATATATTTATTVALTPPEDSAGGGAAGSPGSTTRRSGWPSTPRRPRLVRMLCHCRVGRHLGSVRTRLSTWLPPRLHLTVVGRPV